MTATINPAGLTAVPPHDDHVDVTAAHERLNNFQSLLPGIRLRNEKLIELHAKTARVFRIERVFSVDDVARGKPHPDLFLHAASAMGVEPVDCVVVEDTPTGIAAARQATCASGRTSTHPSSATSRNRAQSSYRSMYSRPGPMTNTATSIPSSPETSRPAAAHG